MYVAAMTHRDELFDLALRWLNNNCLPGDGESLTRIFVYESFCSSPFTRHTDFRTAYQDVRALPTGDDCRHESLPIR